MSPLPHASRRIATLAAAGASLCAVALTAATAAQAATAAPLPAATSSAPAGYVPREVVVGYPDGHIAVQRAPHGESVPQAAAKVARRPGVAYAVPNHIARASYIPDDPGRGGAGNWRKLQWNFDGPYSVNAPGAWTNLLRAGKPGGRGVVIAVLDTGVAYRDSKLYRRSPDFGASQFVRGYDFVDNDRFPDDEFGHGTFVASLLGERVNNGIGLTGLAYGAKIMPVRVLDDQGLGEAAAIGRGIRWAVDHGADVLNLSLEFDASLPASELPEITSAVRYGARHGVVMVAAAGNSGDSELAYPARAPQVISVGATTEHGCQAEYSDQGPGLDLMAPGGGEDADIAEDPVHCRPDAKAGRDVFQLTFPCIPDPPLCATSAVRRFSLPGGYIGTSMAAPHVAAAAAMVIASGVLGPHPSPAAVQRRLESTARDLGPPGYDEAYGYGLLDAAAATAPVPAAPK
jgi:serine protease